jgi:hypothetical protein
MNHSSEIFRSKIAQISQMTEAKVFSADSHLYLLCNLWFQIRRLG